MPIDRHGEAKRRLQFLFAVNAENEAGLEKLTAAREPARHIHPLDRNLAA
jgi:hypothetical protein